MCGQHFYYPVLFLMNVDLREGDLHTGIVQSRLYDLHTFDAFIKTVGRRTADTQAI